VLKDQRTSEKCVWEEKNAPISKVERKKDKREKKVLA